MTIETELSARSGDLCELCGAQPPLSIHEVFPSNGTADQAIHVCSICEDQLSGKTELDSNHWRCLNDKVWSPVPAVQVVAYRLLNKMTAEGWPQELLDMVYLEPEIQEWADVGISNSAEDSVITKDSNGTELNDGDTVTLIKDLDVKGAGFTAKRGTAVRGISLTGDPENIEGRVNGVRIVLKTCFLKKS